MTERKTRISAKLHTAIRLMVEEGQKRPDAAKAAGLHDDSLRKALKRSDVLALRSHMMRVLRESEAARSIARVARLADDAESEHVRLGANTLLLGIEGVVPVQRVEALHKHEHVIPGLSIVIMPRGDAPGIDASAPRPALVGASSTLPKPVPHPALAHLQDEGDG
jgi:hypothetical protein